MISVCFHLRDYSVCSPYSFFFSVPIAAVYLRYTEVIHTVIKLQMVRRWKTLVLISNGYLQLVYNFGTCSAVRVWDRFPAEFGHGEIEIRFPVMKRYISGFRY